MLPVYCLSLCLSAYTFAHTSSCSWCGGRCSAPRATSVSRELQAGLVQVWGTFWEQKPDTAVGRDQKAGLGLVGVAEHQCAALLWPKSLCWGPAAPVKQWKWPVESQTSSQFSSPLDEGWGWTRKTARLKVIFFFFFFSFYTCEALTCSRPILLTQWLPQPQRVRGGGFFSATPGYHLISVPLHHL